MKRGCLKQVFRGKTEGKSRDYFAKGKKAAFFARSIAAKEDSEERKFEKNRNRRNRSDAKHRKDGAVFRCAAVFALPAAFRLSSL